MAGAHFLRCLCRHYSIVKCTWDVLLRDVPMCQLQLQFDLRFCDV